MLINPVLGDEDDDEDENVVIQNGDKGNASEQHEDDDIIVEEEEQSRPGKQQAQEGDDDNLTEEQRRELRRQRKKRQKERARVSRDHDKQLIAGLQNSLAQMNAKLAKLEGKGHQDDAAKVETALLNAQRRAENLKAEIQRATDAGEGDKLAAAVDALGETKLDISKIQDFKARMESASAADKRTKEEENDGEDNPAATEAVIRQTVAKNVSIFTAKHPWYIMSASADEDDDEEDISDSDRVRELDKELTAEGSTPDTAAHWQELEKRIREELPHRFQRKNGRENNVSENNQRQNGQRQNGNSQRGPAMSGGGRNGGNGGGGKGYVLSKDRVAVMKEAGIWDDPIRKKKAIDAYKKFDAENPSTRS